MHVYDQRNSLRIAPSDHIIGLVLVPHKHSSNIVVAVQLVQHDPQSQWTVCCNRGVVPAICWTICLNEGHSIAAYVPACVTNNEQKQRIKLSITNAKNTVAATTTLAPVPSAKNSAVLLSISQKSGLPKIRQNDFLKTSFGSYLYLDGMPKHQLFGPGACKSNESPTFWEEHSYRCMDEVYIGPIPLQ